MRVRMSKAEHYHQAEYHLNRASETLADFEGKAVDYRKAPILQQAIALEVALGHAHAVLATVDKGPNG